MAGQPTASPLAIDPKWIEQLSRSPDRRARRRLLMRYLPSDSKRLADQLYEEVVRLARIDLRQAGRVADCLALLASKQADRYVLAQDSRASGHMMYLTGNYHAAAQKHEAALKAFQQLKLDLQVARTANGMLQPLIYLGRYKRAFALARRARKIFKKHDDRLRVGRLDSNVGNILHRLDRFTEALEYYERARRTFVELHAAEDLAVVLHNMALCYISLSRFESALATYRAARDHWAREQRPLLVARADYNVAYLHYMRGEYTRAIELYQVTRVLCSELGDPYLVALCDLDQSEMYLELNLSEEASELADAAFDGMQKLNLNYEAAKALTFRAMATRQMGRSEQALAIFDRARKLFLQETNRTWCALIDIHKALVLIEQGQHKTATKLCQAALVSFRDSALVGKAALCNLLLARMDLQRGHLKRSRAYCQAAFRQLARSEVPVVEFQAYLTLGQVQEAMGDLESAYRSLQKAHNQLEGLRSHLLGEEFKIAFLKDKLSLYENLVLLSLKLYRGRRGWSAAFFTIERAKSRSLADLIAFQISALQPKTGGDTKLASRLREVDEKLNSTYRQARREEFQSEKTSAGRLQKLHHQSRSYQSELNSVLSEIGATDQEFASLLSAGTVSLDAIRSTLAADSLLLEYYQARDVIYACILGRNTLEIHPVAAADHVRSTLRLLQFQLSKFRLGQQYLAQFAESLQFATRTHLKELHDALIGPVRNKLRADHLIIVPHAFLHYLPFHALTDGDRYLIDEWSLSYAPSASVYHLSAARQIDAKGGSLVLGVPDPLAPNIATEAQAVASILPSSRLFVGEQATYEVLRDEAPSSRYVHIATHGLFRQDNPMFSSIRLGKSELNLFDLYHLRLSCELITLSGCGTGLNVVVGGDELLGLVRGLLYAGTRSMLVTLWDVNDRSTSEFMTCFYRGLHSAANKAIAMQSAMRELRESYPHPYHWAPFLLVGQV